MVQPVAEMAAPVMLLISALAVIAIALIGSGILLGPQARESTVLLRIAFNALMIGGLAGFWAFVKPWDGRPGVKPGLFGRPAPVNQAALADNWRFTEFASGKPTSLHELRGKVVVLNIWATWCPPCVQELPSFRNLMDRMEKHPDVVFVFASVDQEIEAVETFVKKSKLKLPIYLPRDQTPKRLQTGGIPATFVFARDGRLVEKVEGAPKDADWNTDEVVRRLKELSAQSPPAPPPT
jgi:thiol-disulfide isomerase/thioredoxin